MRYEDFELRIRPVLQALPSGLPYEVTVASTLAGEGCGSFLLPGVWISEAATPLHLTIDDEPETARRIGEELFRALLGEVRNLYDFCRGGLWASGQELEEGEEDGLRVRIHFDPSEPASLFFHSLPWETLFYPQDVGFLALHPRRSIVRYLDLQRSIEPPRFELPLKILVVPSSPTTLAPLELAAETELIEKALSLQDRVQVTILDRGTVGELRRALHNGPFDVLHFIGHGVFDPTSGEGYLLLEAEKGEEELLGAGMLGRLLQTVRPPSLVLLNACGTARVSDAESLGSFSSLPAALLQAGVPAVIAMQLSISDAAALAFSAAFYRSLAHGEGLDRAVWEGRLAIQIAAPASLEWVAPALFVRSTKGALFELPPIGPILVSAMEDEGVREEGAPKTLHSFQRDLYRFLGDLRIGTAQDYAKLSEEERTLVSREILNRVIGLGTKPEDLLELQHMNARFPSKLLMRRPEVADSLEALHRQCALYADHSTICFPKIEISPSYGSSQASPVLEESTISLLLRHRELIETGKMSMVPELVRVRGESHRCLFDVRKLETVLVNLEDQVVQSVFLEKGRLFRQSGALVFKAPEGKNLRLPEILEVEDRYRAEYEHFQRHLRETLLAVNPDDDPHSLRRALQAVDAGIRELEGRYQALRRRSNSRQPATWASGALTVVVYTTGAEASPFLASAFAGAALSSLVSFVPEARQIEEEIRSSPFFVPWLVSQGKTSL